MVTKMKFYSLDNILKRDATYNVIFGERSNGKTYASMTKCIKDFVETGAQFGYVRRWKEDVTGRRAATLFAGHIDNDAISKMTDGAFEGVHYYAGVFYLCNYDENGKAIYNKEEDKAGYCFALSDNEHNKSNSFPRIRNIVFDEFLARNYFPNEFVSFMNTVSTIVRKRTDVKIFMLGNTVNKHSPYFEEMGLKHVKNMKQGAIDLYRYGNSELTVAVEYCANLQKDEKSQKYFAFDNPKLQMITGGSWELDIYPHLPMKYVEEDVQFEFVMEIGDELFLCKIVQKGDAMFIYCHRKTTPIKDEDNDLIYSLRPDPRPNWVRDLRIVSSARGDSKVKNMIWWLFKTGKVYYQDNDVGDTISQFVSNSLR